jgi:hypothetical protein
MKMQMSFWFTLALTATSGLHGEDRKHVAYPVMAPVAQYLMANVQDEIALARSAAPASISADAEVLVLTNKGYQTAVHGRNGFVCFVERSWAAGFDDPEFWNPTFRSPNCFNPPAVRSVLPHYLKRAEWLLAGATREQLIEKARAAFASHELSVPEAGSLTYMLSKQTYTPWLPHLMFFVAPGQTGVWGAGKAGSPILGGDGRPFEPTIFMVPVRFWSDGTPAPPPARPHAM